MDERLIDVRTQLAASPSTRIEVGEDGVLHILAGPVTLHLERAVCEELTTTLARAMLVLARRPPKRRAPPLCLVSDEAPREVADPDAAGAALRRVQTTLIMQGERE
jgi:hypothetical protein